MTNVTINWGDITSVREIAGVSSTDFSDSTLTDFLTSARKEVNSKLATKIFREKVLYIDDYRQNKVDGTNTLYFVKHWRNIFGTISINSFADFNYDNTIDISDVVVTQYDPNTQTESSLTISSIDVLNCSITLASAPDNVELYITYAYIPLDPSTPDGFLSLLTNYLAASYCFVGSDGFTLKFGNVTIQPGQSGGKGKQLHDKYEDLLRQIIVNANGGAIVEPMEDMDIHPPLPNRYYRGYNLGFGPIYP